MNIFELFTFGSWTGGAILGGLFGFGKFDVVGAVIGVPVGLAIGLAFAYGCLFIFACLCKICFGGPLLPPKSGPNQPLQLTSNARES